MDEKAKQALIKRGWTEVNGKMVPPVKAEVKADATKAKDDTAEAATKTEAKKQSSSKPAPVGTYDPYGGLSEDQLNELLDPETPLRKSKVSGQQSETGVKDAGVYGSGVTVEEFAKRNPEWAAKFKEKHGTDFDPKKHAKIFQDEYNNHVEQLAKKRAIEAGYDEKEATSIAKRFKDTQGFKEGELKKGDPRYRDTKFGEFTSSRFEPKFTPKKKPVVEKEQDITSQPKENIPGVRPDIRRNPPVEVGKKTYAPWWLQDIVKTSGAAADLARVKKYLPWQDKPEVFLPKATYYDPTRELAANTEQANLASQFHQAFTGPKSGAISGVQGKAFDNAANIMAKYNNLNVGLANQLSQERASILNQASQNQAGLNTQLWDKYTIANQQFDNSKNMARQNLRQSYMDAITNRGKTQALNTLNPNFYTDPSTGFVNFNPGYGPIHANAPGDDFAQQQKIMERFPGTTFKEADDAVNKTKKSDTEAKDNFDPYLRAQGYQNT